MQSVKTLALWGTLAPCFALMLSGAAFAQAAPADPASPAAQQQVYQQQQQQYLSQEQKYEEQAERYRAARDRYATERAHYRRGAWPARYEQSIVVDSTDLLGARVQTANHHLVGYVEEIARGTGGHVDALRVELDRNGGDVWVDAGDLRFDADEKLVMTDLSRQDLNAMSRETF